MTQKIAVITGASEGLGYELSKRLLNLDWKVIGLSRKQPDLSKVEFIKTDLTDPKQIESTIEKIKSDYDSIDLLVNCAGMLSIKPIDGIEYSELDTLFKLNVVAPIYLTSGLIDLIKVAPGDIINIGSSVGFKSYPNQMAYTASKWAIRGINENLKVELTGTGCRVIGFNPGGFKSNLFVKASDSDEFNFKSNTMEPEELAKIIVNIVELPRNMEVSNIIINRV